MKRLIEIFSEPSTYAGFSGIALALGMAASEYEAVSAALAAIFGAVAVYRREKTK